MLSTYFGLLKPGDLFAFVNHNEIYTRGDYNQYICNKCQRLHEAPDMVPVIFVSSPFVKKVGHAPCPIYYNGF